METNEEVDVLNQEEEINIYDDVCNFDFGEEIEKLKAENKKLEDHICSLNQDIDKLNGTITELKETQNNLTKNISTLFMTAKTEIERKNRMIEELRIQVDNRQISRFNSDFRKRKDRENSPSNANTYKKVKYDESTAKSDVSVPENCKQEFKSDERQESKSKYSDRRRHVDDRRHQHKSKYLNDRYSDQFENNKYDTKFGHSNELCSESNKPEFRNKRYPDRYNTYDDDGYDSRSTHLDRYRNEIDERYDSRTQYFDNRRNDYTKNFADRDEVYHNRDYQHYNRNSRSNVGDVTFRDRDEYRGEQERYSKYADKISKDRCDSNYFKNERNASSERSSHSRSGTPFAPFSSDNREDTYETEQDMPINLHIDAERPRSVTPMPFLEDIEEPKPKPPKKRLKMLEAMEKKVKQNRLSQTSRISDQSRGTDKKPPDINKTNISHYDSDKSSVTSSKSTKSDNDDREALGNVQRRPNPVPEKVLVKRRTHIRQSPIKPEIKHFKSKIGSTVVNDEREIKLKSTLDINMKNESKVSSKAAKTVTEQASNIQEKNIDKDVQRSTTNTKTETKTYTGNSEKDSLHEDQRDDINLKTQSQKKKNSPHNNLSTNQTTKNENTIKEMQSQEIFDSKAKEKTGTLTKNINKSIKSVKNEEIAQKCTIQKLEESHNFEKLCETHKENRRKSVNTGLIEGVDSREKTDEKTVVKMVKNKEFGLIEESVKSNQKYSIGSSKEKQVISKEINQENKTVEQDEKCKDIGINIAKNSPHNNLSTNQARKNENKIKEMQNQEIVGSKAKEKIETSTKNVNKGIKSVRIEEVAQKCKTTLQKFEESHKKHCETHKENIGRESVKRGLNDGVDSQEKTDEKTVVKMVKNKESTPIEESVKSSQKYSTRSSKEKQIISKEINQENKTIQQTVKQNEKRKDTGIDTEKKQKQEDIEKDSSKMDKPNKYVTEKQKESKESVKEVNDEKIKEEDTKGSNKSSKYCADQVKPVVTKQDVTNAGKGKDKNLSNKKDKDLKKNDQIIDQSKKEDQLIENQISEVEKRGLIENVKNYDVKGQSKKGEQLIENQPSEVERKEELKEKSDVVKCVNKQPETNKTKKFQLEPEHNIKPAEYVRQRQRKSTFTEQNDVKNEMKNSDKHFEKEDIGKSQECQNIAEKKTEQSVGKIKSKATVSVSKQDINVPFQTDEKQDTTILSQKHAEKRHANIFEHQTVQQATDQQDVEVDHKNEKHSESSNIKNSEDTDKADTNINQGEQRNWCNVVKRRIRFSDKEEIVQILDQDVDRKSENVCNKTATKENDNCPTVTEVKQVVLTNFENYNNIDVPVTTELIEKRNSPIKQNITRKDDDSMEANKQETPKCKNKKRKNSSEEESSTKHMKNENVSTTSSSTNSETESQGDSSDDILSSVKYDNRLIEIKDVEQENARQMESIVSLSDSSTSDDTIIINKTNSIKTIEKKFDSLIKQYIENFVAEDTRDNLNNVIAADNNHPASTEDNPKVEVKSQENFLKEDVVAKTSEPKIKVLEIINIVNVQQKPEVHKSSNDVVNPVSGSSKESSIKRSTITSNSTIQSSSPNSSRPTRRRITPTPVKDDKPLCSFENILTKACQPETFITTVQTIESPLHLTHDGEIPVLHLDENHINDLPTEVNINDKNILNLLDTMNISNIDCDIPKFNAETGTNPEASASSGDKCTLTFENKIENTKSSPVKSQEAASGVPNCATPCGASISNVSSHNVAGPTVLSGTAPATNRRRRRRCWMIIKD